MTDRLLPYARRSTNEQCNDYAKKHADFPEERGEHFQRFIFQNIEVVEVVPARMALLLGNGRCHRTGPDGFVQQSAGISAKHRHQQPESDSDECAGANVQERDDLCRYGFGRQH